MLRLSISFATAILLVSATSCGSGRHSAAGFRLPADGDIERGKVAFTQFQCHTCHEVSGVELPRPTVQPAVPVVLGGETVRVMTDGYLVASIINPSHALAPYSKVAITTSDGKSRMPEYVDSITARQIADIVTFLQSHYTVKHVGRGYGPS